MNNNQITTKECEGAQIQYLEKEFLEVKSYSKEIGIYLKGLTGQKSNLSEEEWIYVRTNHFKEYFGDWERYFKCQFLLNGPVVCTLTGEEFAPIEGKNLTDRVVEYFKGIGGMAYSPFFGNVILNKKGVDDSIGHGVGRNKAIAFAAVKDVIENGVLVDYDKNHKGRGYDGAVISAPIEIKEERYICSVVITRMKDNRFYLHEVIEQKKLSDEGSNSVQRQPQRLKAFAKILQNILSAKDLQINISLDKNGEPMY